MCALVCMRLSLCVCMCVRMCVSDFEVQSLAHRCPSIICLSSSAQPTLPRAALYFKELSNGHTHTHTSSLHVPVGQGGLAWKCLANSLQE